MSDGTFHKIPYNTIWPSLLRMLRKTFGSRRFVAKFYKFFCLKYTYFDMLNIIRGPLYSWDHFEQEHLQDETFTIEAYRGHDI